MVVRWHSHPSVSHMWKSPSLTLSGQEIGIHHKNTVTFLPNAPEKVRQHYQAEMLNRERTWFACVSEVYKQS